MNDNWGEPKWVPQIHKVCEFCLSVSLSVHAFMVQKFIAVIYGYLQLLITVLRCILYTALYANIQQTHSDKQHDQIGSDTKKQVYHLT